MSQQEEVEYETVTLTDEEGNDREFALLTLVELEEGTFAVLAPLDQLEAMESEEDEGPGFDLYAFAYNETDDGVDLDPVEDEALLERVFEVAEEILFGDELEDEDEDDDDDDSEDDVEN